MLKEQQKKLTASELATIAAMDRTNASRYLNELVKDQLVAKDESRLVTRSSQQHGCLSNDYLQARLARKNNMPTIDLEALIANDVDKYFDNYYDKV